MPVLVCPFFPIPMAMAMAMAMAKGGPSLRKGHPQADLVPSYEIFTAFVPRSQPLSSFRAGGEGLGALRGSDPSKRPGRVPRPPPLAAPLRGAAKGAREGT